MLTAEELKKVLRYESDSGEFFWIVHRTGTATAGSVAGSLAINLNGVRYIRFTIFGKRYLGHRIAWLYVYGQWPDGQIDHINGDGTDNRISNLRIVDKFAQNQNRRTPKSNTSGVKGVSWKKARNKWQAQIEAHGVTRYLGMYTNLEAAKKAYEDAARVLHGEFVRGAA
jgi:hypothetical protein